MSAALCGLLPNLEGPGGRIRRLYAATVNAVAFYGAPVWTGRAMTTRSIKVQRGVAIRVARDYRTVSHAAAIILAGTPLVDFLVLAYAEMYGWARELRGRRMKVTAKIRDTWRLRARRKDVLRWQCQTSPDWEWQDSGPSGPSGPIYPSGWTRRGVA